MSWEEKLFGWIHGSITRAFTPARDEQAIARQALLSDLRGRLTLLASAIAERNVEIRDAESGGAAHSLALTLPLHLDFAPDIEGNVTAYVVRVAFAATALRHGIVLPSEATSPAQVALATALAIPLVDRHLDEELPSVRPMRDRLLAHLPDRAETPDASALLEELVRTRLGARSSTESPRLTGFAGEVAALEVRGSASLGTALAALGPSLAALGKCRRAPVACPLIGWLGRASSGAPSGDTSRVDADALPSGTEIRGKARESVVEVKLAKDPDADNPLIHSFEKVQTAEEYKGGQRTPDGSDSIEDHQEALEELDLREIVRSREQTRSLLRSDVMMESAAFELAEEAAPEPGIPYDEWDHKTRSYREGWCSVRTEALVPRHGWADAESRIGALARRSRPAQDALRAELRRIELSRRWRDRQLDGPEIDVGAMVDRHAALASGHTPPGHLYSARRSHAPSLAVMVLLDGSLSTDGWVSDRRVLDVEIEAAVVLGEALDGLDIELGIGCFRSNTRRDCRFAWLTRMGEDWRRARRRLGALEPAGYTRIGPAIRHATAMLARTEARRRLLLVITDGKPTDYDRYEGRYGIADVRQAVREAERLGIRVDALAVDATARFTLPAMFGPSRHHTLHRPADLPIALGRICADMHQ